MYRLFMPFKNKFSKQYNYFKNQNYAWEWKHEILILAANKSSVCVIHEK